MNLEDGTEINLRMYSTYTIEEICAAAFEGAEIVREYRQDNIFLSLIMMKIHMRVMYIMDCYDIKKNWYRKLWMNAGWELIDLLDGITGT